MSIIINCLIAIWAWLDRLFHESPEEMLEVEEAGEFVLKQIVD